LRTIGLIGGMSWESSAEYYRLLNRGVQQRLGGQHCADLVLVNVDFEPIQRAQHAGDWPAATALLITAATRLRSAGADFGLLCTNTMHKVFDELQAALPLPFIHIADATAARIRADGVGRVGLLGTAFTMEQEFYRQRLESRGLHVLIPQREDRAEIHRVIYQELCRGQIRAQSRAAFVDAIRRLADAGAEAVILGCTEITLLVSASDSPLPVFDTTRIHCEAALERALAQAGDRG
jgi:aspartate racemase